MDEALTLIPLQRRLTQVAIKFHRMLTRHVFPKGFQPNTLGLELSTLFGLRPGDLVIIALFGNGLHQEAIFGRVRLTVHDTVVLDLLVVRGHFLGSERKRVLDRGLAQLPMDALLDSKTGGLILVARNTDVDALWPRLIDFPKVYEVEVLESNLILLD